VEKGAMGTYKSQALHRFSVPMVTDKAFEGKEKER
jgi:hypothetical protein